MKNLQSEAIILRRTNYGEADRILNLLTPNNGKISAIARSVRKAKSKLAGSLELLSVLQVGLIERSVGMPIVTSAQLIQFFGNIITEYERTQLAYEFIKQVNRITETVAEPEFYDLLKISLTALNNLNLDYRFTELWFRIRLIGLLGRGLNTVTDHTGKRLSAGQDYDFDFDGMSFVAVSRGKFSSEHIKLLRLAALGEPGVLGRIVGAQEFIDDCLWLARLIET